MKPATSSTRLKERFPLIQGPPAQDICYATENRQMAVKAVVAVSAICCWWWDRRTARIRKRLVEVCENAGVRVVPGRRLGRSRIRPGWTASRTWRSPPARRRRRHLVEELIASLQRPRLRPAGGSGAEGGRRALLAARRAGACGFRLDDNFHAMSPTVCNCTTALVRAASAQPLDARRRILLGAAGPRRLLVGGTHRRYHARIRFHSAAAVAASAGGWRLESAHARR